MERFSASKAARLISCAGSANLELAIPGWTPPVEDRTADTAANRGTSMHEIMASIARLPRGEAKNFVAAAQYIDELRGRRRFQEYVEMEFPATWLKDNPMTTADLVLCTADEMHIVDLKTGRIPVEPEGNAQLMFYAVTYLPLAPKVKGVSLHIVQPWAGIMRGWYVSKQELAQFKKDAVLAHQKMLQEDTSLNPGDHCMFCPANPHSRGLKGSPKCPAMMQILYPHAQFTAEDLELD